MLWCQGQQHCHCYYQFTTSSGAAPDFTLVQNIMLGPAIASLVSATGGNDKVVILLCIHRQVGLLM